MSDQGKVHQKLAIFTIDVAHDWLTADGEESEEQGWQEIEGQLATRVSWPFASDGPALKFLEFEELPE